MQEVIVYIIIALAVFFAIKRLLSKDKGCGCGCDGCGGNAECGKNAECGTGNAKCEKCAGNSECKLKNFR
ncbi:MAG: FeoB-associated Cys-rich membrane protein [Paludibacteraceae bacterium]|nr:FeoB-associated Cys-rich membrane protein [Paludibacteraceae bacterium]